MDKALKITQDTLTRIGRLEELLIWIIQNNQDTDINLPNDDIIVEISMAAASSAEAEMRSFQGENQ